MNNMTLTWQMPVWKNILLADHVDHFNPTTNLVTIGQMDCVCIKNKHRQAG